MKKIFTSALLIISCVVQVVAQKYYVPAAVERTSEIQSSYPIDGSALLRADWEKIGPILREYSLAHPQSRSLRKTAAWNFTEGT